MILGAVGHFGRMERELIKKQYFTDRGNEENDVACFHWLA